MERKRKIVLPACWMEHLEKEFEEDYMKKLRFFLLSEKKKGKEIYPPRKEIFAAFQHTPFEKIKVVILGQDPYHGPQQAQGLSFSVHSSLPIPPSLLNIYKELENDLDIAPAQHGSLVSWAKEGVLLLNAVLSVERHKPASHKNRGWELFSDRVVDLINKKRQNIAFLLWGAYAQKKGIAINREKHFVLTSAHPSPFSAHRGFLGSRPFSRVNSWLESRGVSPIDWRIPPLYGT